MKSFIIIYCFTSVLWQIGYTAWGWFTWKQSLKKNPELKMVVDHIMGNLRVRLFKKKALPTFLILVGVASIIAAPVLFPVELWPLLRRLIFGKSDLERRAETVMQGEMDMYAEYGPRAVHKDIDPDEPFISENKSGY